MLWRTGRRSAGCICRRACQRERFARRLGVSRGTVGCRPTLARMCFTNGDTRHCRTAVLLILIKGRTLCDVPENESELQTMLFLMDGLCRAPSPVLMIVSDVEMAGKVALAIHDGSAPWEDRPQRVGTLLRLDLAGIAGFPADAVATLASELGDTDDWLFLPDIGVLLESPSGRRFLDELMRSVANGGVAAVIASVSREVLARLPVECPRLMGFATVLNPGEAGAETLTYARSIVSSSNNPEDVGWLITVRYELSQKIANDPDSPITLTDSRLQLVDRIQMVVRDDAPPLGVIISLASDAFSVAQEDAALETAAIAAKCLVGRALRRDEDVVAARAIFYG